MALAYLHWLFLCSVVAISLFVYFIGNKISYASSPQMKKYWLFAGITTVIAILIFFKYIDFLRIYIAQIWQDSAFDILFPLGISYYIFQSIAYLVASYRSSHHRLNWNELLLHLSFFPTITAGPIIRVDKFKTIYGDEMGMLSQIRTARRQILMPALAIGLILLGIAKKWWWANSLSINWVEPVFQNPLQYDPISILVAIYGYTLQLFWDFSGYTDLVVGISLLLGFKLPYNFNMPLIAYNLKDFWNRWHITLSTWIRDYIYIPLGGNRHGKLMTQCYLFIAMFLSGIWHGNNFNFALWGICHALGLIFLNMGEYFFNKKRLSATPFGKLIAILITFHFVAFTFVIFKTDNLSDLSLILNALVKNPMTLPNLDVIIILITFILLFIFYKKLVLLFHFFVQFLERVPIVYWFIPIILILMMIITFSPTGIPGFIYANF